MTQAELDRILAVWQERLRLGNWDIKIRWELKPEAVDVEAEIRVHEDYDQASIRIRSGFEDWSERHANATIVHELLHVFERGTKLAIEAMELVSTAGAFELLSDRYQHEAEGWIDRLAFVLVDLAGNA